MDVTPPPRGTIAIYSDIGCPWARLCVNRLHRLRASHGLEDAVRFEHRTFPLELVNRRASPKRILDAETAVLATLDDRVDWRIWQSPPETYPVTTLPAMEAVQAVAALGDVRGAEQLDLALRDAMFRHSRCISLVPVILETAQGVAGVDVSALAGALSDGRARSRVTLAPESVSGSPHLFLHDGTSAFNPGMQVRMREGHLPVVEADDVSVLEGLLLRAASA